MATSEETALAPRVDSSAEEAHLEPVGTTPNEGQVTKTKSHVNNEPAQALETSKLKSPTVTDLSDAGQDIAQGTDVSNDNDQERPLREKLKKTSIGTLPKPQTEAEAIVVEETESDTSRAMAPVNLAPLHGSESDNAVIDRHNEGSGPSERYEEELVLHHNVGKTTMSIASGMPFSHPEADHESPDYVKDASAKCVDQDSAVVSSAASSPDAAAPVENMDDQPTAHVMSPRKKRSRDQFDNDHEKESEGVSAPGETDPKPSEGAEKEISTGHPSTRTAREQPEKKRPRDVSQDSAGQEDTSAAKPQIPSSSGFSNTSATSPFGMLGAGKMSSVADTSSAFAQNSSGNAQASSTLFANSAFAALSGSTTSPFGTRGASSASTGFHGVAASEGKSLAGANFSGLGSEGPSMKTGGVGGAGTAAPSPFSLEASGFGKLGTERGGGFGIAGSKLTNFASKNGPGIIGLSQTPSKPFGAPAEEEDEEEDSEEDQDGEKDGRENSKEPKEERRLHHYELATGEEGEETLFSARAKLFHFVPASKAWRERGYGVLKLNVFRPPPEVSDDNPEDDPWAHERQPMNTWARLLMRSDGVWKVILNTKISKDTKIGDWQGNAPSDKYIRFKTVEDGKWVAMQLKLGNHATSMELWRQVKQFQEELEQFTSVAETANV